ncbi:ABC transporter ATP-binding protein/permease [Macrococcus armenti]|nr:ABC transporter ATP-binding protein [Macrococcus armenti]UBH23464.1 ABC transporter ATP-binding protein/permease [Macrococcus armenti]
MREIIKFTFPYRLWIVIALLLMLAELAVELSLPIILSFIINDGLMKENMDATRFYLILLLVLSAFAFICGVVNSFIASHVCHGFSFDLRTALFNKVQQFALKHIEKFKTSSLITRLTNDVIACEMVLFMSLRIMLRAPLLVLGSIIMSFIVAPHLALYLLIGAPLIFIFLYFTSKKGMQIFLKVQEKLDHLNRNVQQNLSAVRMIRANMSADYETMKFGITALSLKDDTTKALKLMERILPFLLIVMNSSLLLIIYIGALDITEGVLNVGALVAVINYALRMQGGFSMFAFIIIAFSRAKASADRMQEILLTETSSDDHTEQIEISGGASVSFRNVSFKYPLSHQYALKDITFNIDAGEKFVIMGATGSGKSALLSLLPRMYDVSEGEILINGINIKSIDTNILRTMIGYVPQRNILFTGSVFDNIIFGNRQAETEDVTEATKIAQVHQNILDFDDAYGTKVGQEGVNLSGGQKQRLAIARAVIKSPSILILDDSTSALDVHTENNLFEALSKLSMTRIIVTQKIQTAKSADHILLLDQGEIVAFGTHNALLKSSQLYKAINDSQERGDSID